MFSPVDIIIILLIGVGAGVITGIMGGSGVIVVVPALVLTLAFPIHTAIGTSLVINIIAALVAAFIYYRHGNIYVRPGLWIALGSVAGAQVGSIFAHMIPPMGMNNLFSLLLIPMGIILWVRGVRGAASMAGAPASESDSASQAAPVMTRRSTLFAVGLGLFVGVMCGLFGAGGGVMILLILIFVLHYPLHLAVGTSSFIMAITAASGAVGYAIQNSIDIYVGLIASVSTVLATALGAWVANRVSEVTLGKIIGAILVVLGIAMVVIQYAG